MRPIAGSSTRGPTPMSTARSSSGACRTRSCITACSRCSSASPGGRIAERAGRGQHQPLELFLLPGPGPRRPLQGAQVRADADGHQIVADRLGDADERREGVRYVGQG